MLLQLKLIFEIDIEMYAILDIETTGGQFNEEGITEIAIYKFDGHEIVDQFISLVNPEKEIQELENLNSEEYNAIIRNLRKWNGEDVDLVYSITYPYNIDMTIINGHNIPKCVFYTSEFATLDSTFFVQNPNLSSDESITKYVKENKNLYMTSPSVWSSLGMVKYGLPEEKNRIIKIVELLAKEFPKANLSIDTFRSSVADECLSAGASIINDITNKVCNQFNNQNKTKKMSDKLQPPVAKIVPKTLEKHGDKRIDNYY